jgi:hypothetical protein
MANNKSILINYGSEAITNDASGFVPGKTATLYTKGHLLENDITVAFPSEYVIPEGEIEIKTNNTTVNVAGKATAKVQITIPEGPDVSGVDANAVDVLEGKWFYGENGKQKGTLPLLQNYTFTLTHDDSSTDQTSYILVPAEDTYNYFALQIGDSGHVVNGIRVSLADRVWDKSFILN